MASFETRRGFSMPGGDGADAGGERAAQHAQQAQHQRASLRSFGQARRVRLSPFASISAARGAPVFASLSTGFVSTLGSASGGAAGARLEPATSASYPVELCHVAKPCASLAGLGVRAKRLLGVKNINVYAVGIYVDALSAKKALSKYADDSEDAIAANAAMFDDVVRSSSFEKSLRLVISFGHLKRSQFLDALHERLEPRMTKAGDAAALDAFRAQFDDVTLQKGTEIVFVNEGAGLVTSVDGARKGRVTSPALCASLFDIYLGPDAVAPDAKASFGRSVASILKSERIL